MVCVSLSVHGHHGTLSLCQSLCVLYEGFCVLCVRVLVVLEEAAAAANAGGVPAVYGEAAGLCKAGTEMERKREKEERKREKEERKRERRK